MNILITGGSGFIGKNLRKYLKGKYHIFVPSHRELDLLDSGKVRNFIKKNKIRVIIHGANAGGGRDTIGMENVVEHNLRMFFNIARCEDLVERIIHFGSGAEYGKSRDLKKVKEGDFDKLIPKDDYGFSKYVISKYISVSNETFPEPFGNRYSDGNVFSPPHLMKVSHRSKIHKNNLKKTDFQNSSKAHSSPEKFKFICLRLFGVYGKYENYLFKFISNSIVKNLLKMPIVIGQNVRFDYLYIDDLVRIVDYFVKNRDNGYRDYNAASGETVTLLQIARIVNRISGFRSGISFKNRGMNLEYSANNSRLRGEIPDLRFTSIEEGVGKMYQWYKEHLKGLDIEKIRKDPYIKMIKPKI